MQRTHSKKLKLNCKFCTVKNTARFGIFSCGLHVKGPYRRICCAKHDSPAPKITAKTDRRHHPRYSPRDFLQESCKNLSHQKFTARILQKQIYLASTETSCRFLAKMLQEIVR